MFAPTAFPIAPFMQIFPYGLARLNKERFASAVRHGYLVAKGENGHRATESGESLGARTFGAANEAIAGLKPIPAEPLQGLLDLLACMSDVALATPEPPSPFVPAHKRAMCRRLGMIDARPGFVAHCLELEGYRDDASITTWQSKQVEGHAWEGLALLSGGEALTLAARHATSNRRGVTAWSAYLI